MFRTHTNGELTLKNLNEKVTLSGWVQTIRDKGFMVWIDLRDRYGITQLVFDADRTSAEILENAKKLGREFVIQAEGTVIERASKNPKIPTGEIEILVEKLTILNSAELPPFTIEDETDVWFIVSVSFHRFIKSHSWEFTEFFSSDVFQ